MTNIVIKIFPGRPEDLGPWWVYIEWFEGEGNERRNLLRSGLVTKTSALAVVADFLLKVE